MKILVTGGVGYIGAVTAHALVAAGHDLTVFDHAPDTHHKLGTIPLVTADLLDPSAISQAIADTKPDAVVHFAAYIQMGESVRDPQKYYTNNVFGSYNLFSAMVEHKVSKLVFSSSAGVYGNPRELPIPEDACKEPTNPYGETKLAVERLLKWYEEPYGLKSISIRYFNAAGATLDGKLGEDHEEESHLIPNIIDAQLHGKEFTLFGNDYQTVDGTCVRDYIHVTDLADAHIKALEALASGAKSTAYNAGTGVGYSNLEVVKMVERVASEHAQKDPEIAEGSVKIKLKYAPRRPGDAGTLVADVSKISKELNWLPKFSDLESIVKSAYQYHSHSILEK